ncbi:hypothetical protein HOLleu_06542 [Holothuria leucospilota]|uniref:Domain of unknown function with conserved HDNR motif domain-containing protein n=1 Tax=Holothuria leucospilota TaxID=206669 RepID=A0A9Q1HF80_HOLLE|nr:hypothetical protein HOLleu_06542 [Holothuria leucospilota]
MGGHSQGSWFSSGYHGHFRSKPRNDFTNRYRQESKPSPPQKFVRRIQDRPSHHNFSHHDNRFSFLNTVTSFQDGLGKKKVTNRNSGKFRPDFIAWIPHAKEIHEAGPLVSIYRETHGASDSSQLPQILVGSVKKCSTTPEKLITLKSPYTDPSDYDTSPLETTYRVAHQHLQPNPNVQTNMSTGVVENEHLSLEVTNKYINPRIASIYENPRRLTRRSRVSSAPVLRSSVAQCLVWHDYNELSEEVQRPKTAMAALPPTAEFCLETMASQPNSGTNQNTNTVSE